MKTVTDCLAMIDRMNVGDVIIGGPEGNDAKGVQMGIAIHKTGNGYTVVIKSGDESEGIDNRSQTDFVNPQEAYEWVALHHRMFEANIEKTVWLKQIDENHFQPM